MKDLLEVMSLLSCQSARSCNSGSNACLTKCNKKKCCKKYKRGKNHCKSCPKKD